MNPLTLLHLDAADRNQTIARRMLSDFDPGVTPSHDDWVITIIFYSALHLVDALLIDNIGHKPENHVRRDRIVERDPTVYLIAPWYFTLKDMSQTARYQPVHSFSPQAVQHAFDLLHEIQQTVTTSLDSE